MSYSEVIFWFLIVLLVLYVVFLAVKLLHEIRYHKKPFIALAELAHQQQNPDPEDKLLQEVVLVGDFGNISVKGQDCVLMALQQHLTSAGDECTVALLGDNVYPVGLPPEGHRHRQLAQKRLDIQIELFSRFKGRTFYLSGNHDWNKGRPDGYQQLLRQEAYVTSHLGPVYLPANGCPGPVLVELDPNLALIIINTQWWVQRGERPIGEDYGCKAETEKDFFLQFKNLLTENRHRNIVVLAHHPLYSNALHGGKHTFKHHVFPLTAAHKKLFIPMPVMGSLYPIYRKLFGAAEDMAHPRYRKMRRKLVRILREFSNVVYCAGHDHNLQHFRRHGHHYLVSGSASKTSFVRRGGKASFTHEALGFFSLLYYTSGQVWLRAIEPDTVKNDGTTNIVYQTRLY